MVEGQDYKLYAALKELKSRGMTGVTLGIDTKVNNLKDMITAIQECEAEVTLKKLELGVQYVDVYWELYN